MSCGALFLESKKFRPTLPAATSVAALLFALVLSLVASEPAHAQAYAVLRSFSSQSDGGFPTGGLVRDQAGNMYGTTAGDRGIGDYRVVFQLSSNGSLYSISQEKPTNSGPTGWGVAYGLSQSRGASHFERV